MPPATLTKPRSMKSETLQARCEQYLRQQFPVVSPQRLKISHLWENRYRVTIYDTKKSPESVLTYEKIMVSHFIRISIGKKGQMNHIIAEEKKNGGNITV